MESLKRVRDFFRIRGYYSARSYNSRGYIASLIDKFIFGFAMFLIIFLYLYTTTKKFKVSVSLAIVGFIAYLNFIYKLNKKKNNENIKIINKKLSVEKIYMNFMNKSTDSYIDYTKEIMYYYGIRDMNKIIRKDLDIIGIIDGERVGIKCYQYSEEHRVDRNDIKNFFIEIRDKDIKRGIIITTSSFSEEAKDFFNNIKSVNISFLTLSDIIEIIKDTPIYPKEEYIRKMILEEIDDSRSRVKNESKKIISKSNTKSCIISGILIIFFSKYTIFKSYYKVSGIILIILGLIPIIKSSISLILSGNTREDNI